ncbi:MAG: DUF1997 domain-containing protein [Microcystis aeruginosa TA09]|nr:MAG: DUF1997 domain-containing protein [Microcystis aeruginosa TA09]
MQRPPINSLARESVEVKEDNQFLGFQTHFAGCMDMYSNQETVADYLRAHEGWFCRCAEPMKTLPFGDNGYIITIGKYGAFGYELEPKIAVVLDLPVNGVYHTRSVPIPDQPFLGYLVDYQAIMKLEEMPLSSPSQEIEAIFRQQGLDIPAVITQVTWQLHMEVMVKFPKFIYKIPRSILQKTGDKLLTQIVRQVSPRLTYKVQEDFHSSFNLPLPPASSRLFYRLDSWEGGLLA